VAVYTSNRVVFGQAFANTLLAALNAIPGAKLINAAKLRLSQLNGFNPTPQSTIASLAANEATFTGYTPGGYAFAATPVQNLSPNAQGTVTAVVASATGSTTGNTIYGYWIDDGTNFIMGEAFPVGQSVQFANAGDFLEVIVEIPVQLRQATF
jgi:hypothetical protein